MEMSVFNSEFDQYFCTTEHHSLNPWFDELFKDAKTDVRILIVADGSISFVRAEFGLSEFLLKGIMTEVEPWMELQIVKAHRALVAQGADICGFRFDKHTLDYDQIWLFGHEPETLKDDKPNPNLLSPKEITALAKFMNSGRGVFATGDHEDLGAALCGNIPRVRNMRKWFLRDNPPPRNTEHRLDTLREGFDQGFLTNDQGDEIPQEIRPIFKLDATGTNSFPHEILRGRQQLAIRVLPDHMHEGECMVPTNLTEKITLEDKTSFYEYPDSNPRRIEPEVVALSTSVGGFVPDLPMSGPPVKPRTFAIIVAYDGHKAGSVDGHAKPGVGRVVVDSSFHHFVDINLRGERTGDPLKRGLYDRHDRPTRDYEDIKQYYRNMRRWLLPPEKQQHYFLNMLLACRYLSPLVEEIRFVESPDLHNFRFAGKATYKAISNRFSRNHAMHCAFFAAQMVTEDLRKQIEIFLEPWSTEAISPSPVLRIFNFHFILDVLLGGAMLGIARKFPENPYDVPRELPNAAGRIEELRKVVAAEVLNAGKTLKNEICNSPEGFKQLSETLNSF